MTETTKTVLIAGGVAVGAFLLVKTLAPPPVPKGPPSTVSSLAGVIGSISAIGSGLSNLFKGSSAGASSSGGATAAEVAASGFDTNNYSVSNGFMFADDNGKFLAG